MGDDVEDVKRRIAELSAKVEVLSLKYATCLKAIAKLRAELESIKREVKRIRSFNVETLKAYEMVGTDEPEP